MTSLMTRMAMREGNPFWWFPGLHYIALPGTMWTSSGLKINPEKMNIICLLMCTGMVVYIEEQLRSPSRQQFLTSPRKRPELSPIWWKTYWQSVHGPQEKEQFPSMMKKNLSFHMELLFNCTFADSSDMEYKMLKIYAAYSISHNQNVIPVQACDLQVIQMLGTQWTATTSMKA